MSMFKLNSHPGVKHLAVYSKLIVQAAQWGGEVAGHGYPAHHSISVSDEGDNLNLA